MDDYTPTFETLIHHFLEKPDYRPLKQHELAGVLKIKGSMRASFRHALYRMEREGRIVRLRKNRWALPDTGRQLTGELRVNVQGFGFVTPETPGVEDVYIPSDQLGAALDGDRVIVRVDKSLEKAPLKAGPVPVPRKLQGRIVRVVDRQRKSVVGLLKRTAYYWYVIPDNPRITQTIRVREFSAAVTRREESRKVVAQLDPWDLPTKPLTGIVVEDLGRPDVPGVDMLCVLRDHQIDTEFTPEAQTEAQSRHPDVSEADLQGRRDLRKQVTFTIDPEDARDYDDAVSLQRNDKDQWVLGVHIADVAHYVKIHSAIDREALQRGNTVYLVDRAVTMLPPHLTSEICSLKPHKDRLTHTAEITLNAEGGVIRSELFPSVIRSAARLTYEQVQAVFDGTPDHGVSPEVLPPLAEMRKLARLLRRRRVSSGAIDLTIPEVRILLDGQGRPTGVKKRGCHEAYNLIEEFMLMANCAVAGFLSKKEVPMIYRIHEPPDEDQWGQMALDLRALGVTKPPDDRHALNEIARSVTDSPMEYSVNLAILRNFKRALYSPARKEHFGLACSCYTHFTSPIRRYPDLVVHRMLYAVEAGGRPPYTHDEAARMASHCSKTERAADDAEEESVEIKRVEYYAQRLLEGDRGPYEGLVVSVVPKGLIVELTESLQRGMVPFASIRDDYYVANAERTRATGQRRRKVWSIGQPVRVMLERVDRKRRLIDFSLYEASAARKKRRKKRRR